MPILKDYKLTFHVQKSFKTLRNHRQKTGLCDPTTKVCASNCQTAEARLWRQGLAQTCHVILEHKAINFAPNLPWDCFGIYCIGLGCKKVFFLDP